jgi:iron complex outermembrane recepter protein
MASPAGHPAYRVDQDRDLGDEGEVSMSRSSFLMMGGSVLATAAAAMIFTAAPAAAQPASSPVATENAEMTEIIVTARKRQESILKVPVIETAISQKQLEQYQTNDIYAVAQRVPGFVIGTGTGAYGAQVSLRGVGTSALNPTLDQSISLVLDGLPLSQGLAYQAGMFDVGQIEVLKGPQSLFYGKNSPGGVIALRSADPTDKAELILTGGYEYRANERLGEIIVSGPVAPSLKLRLAAHYSAMDGYFKNRAIAPSGVYTSGPLTGLPLALGGVTPKFRDFSPTEDWIVRGTALFNPGDVYDARLKMNFTRKSVEGDGGEGQLAFCPDGIVGPNLGFGTLQFISPADNCKIDENVYIVDISPASMPGIRGGGVRFQDIWQAFGSLEQNFHLPHNLTLTSVTGLYTTQQEDMISGGASGYIGPTLSADNTFYRRDLTQELRLTSDFTDIPVNFMVGGFYQDASAMNHERLRGNVFLGVPALITSAKQLMGIHAVSGFGQVIWNVTPKVEIAAGARWTHEARKLRQWNFTTGDVVTFPEIILGVHRISSDNLSPEVSVTYKPTDDLTVFGSYKQAFKSGSFNTVSPAAPGSNPSFGDEEARGGEMGIKSRWLDRRLTINLAAYRYHYSNLQVGASFIDPVSGAVAIKTVNAAAANIHGVEMEVAYSPAALEGLSLHGAVNYNHARYGTFDNAQCFNGQTIGMGCNRVLDTTTGRFTSQDLSNRPLVRAPDWTANFGFDYTAPIGEGWKVTVGSATTWSSRYYTNLIDQPGYRQKAYFKTDANITLSGPNDGWEVALIGKNLNDELTTGSCINGPIQSGVIIPGQTISGAAASGPGGQDEAFCNVDRGQEVWVRVTVRPFELFNK